MWNFEVCLWISTQNILPIHWNVMLHNVEILRALLSFKRPLLLLKRPHPLFLERMVKENTILQRILQTSHEDLFAYSQCHAWGPFSIVIQISREICFRVTLLHGIISLQSLAHATTAQLLWHVQNFIAITSLKLGWEGCEISIEFEFLWKIVREMSPWSGDGLATSSSKASPGWDWPNLEHLPLE